MFDKLRDLTSNPMDAKAQRRQREYEETHGKPSVGVRGEMQLAFEQFNHLILPSPQSLEGLKFRMDIPESIRAKIHSQYLSDEKKEPNKLA